MANGINAEQYRGWTASRKLAFEKIARELGKDHPVTQLMGSRAWGRDKFEEPANASNANTSLRTAIEALAALEGAFDVLNAWCLANDTKAQQVLMRLWPRGRR